MANTASSSTITFPDFISYCDYPLRINPSGPDVAKASEQWLLDGAPLSERKRKAFLGLKSGDLSAMCYPDVEADRLRVVADYMNYLFKLDDWSDEFEADEIHVMRDCVMGCLEDPVGFATEEPVGLLTKSFFSRFVKTGGPGCRQRFIDTMELFFRAVTQQALDRINDDIPDLESYIALRRDTSGCKPCFALIEYAAGIDLPDEVVNHRSIKILEDAANDLVSWSNDIYSFNVEQARGDTHNSVIIVMNEQGLDIQAAMDHVGSLCFATLNTFSRTRASLPSWGPDVDADVEKYVMGLQDWIIGSLHWSFLTKRYFGKNGEEVKNTLTVALLPKKTAQQSEVQQKEAEVSPSF
ncbi:hypothetical protein EWM64_g7086 [Hericium alpestre]|uniref:Terpene synthase n=1 Tax=Hericium alpestre TaxID=135208 RepID=A0A4Y9ZPU9_9AGAM|nr:hypothetical protein EWM64_g7086 [Hericium alpestre]